MEFNFVIGSLKSPAKDQGQAFLDALKAACEGQTEEGASLIGCIIVEGPGCTNYGLLVEAPTQEAADHLVRPISIAMQPGKWGNAHPRSDLVKGVWKDLR
jgi:hypothetical protein